MMAKEELKTLKEIKESEGWIDTPINTIRAEAIKWVKDYREWENLVADGAIDFIIKFFNLTEEDLK